MESLIPLLKPLVAHNAQVSCSRKQTVTWKQVTSMYTAHITLNTHKYTKVKILHT